MPHSMPSNDKYWAVSLAESRERTLAYKFLLILIIYCYNRKMVQQDFSIIFLLYNPF